MQNDSVKASSASNFIHSSPTQDLEKMDGKKAAGPSDLGGKFVRFDQFGQ